MTGARFGRAGKGRFFICLGAMLIFSTVGFIVIKLQLDEARRIELRYEQQLEGLKKNLKLERNQCEQLKYNLEIQSQKQDEIKERVVLESNTKLQSLQQHYKLLKNQYDDFKEEFSKIKTKLNTLQSTLNSCENQKAKYFASLNEKHGDQPQKVSTTEGVKAVLKNDIPNPSTQQTLTKNFNAQIAISDKLYAIPIKFNNNNATTSTTTTTTTTKTPAIVAPAINKTSLKFNQKTDTNDSTTKSNHVEQKPAKFPLGVVPFVQPIVFDPAILSSENIKHGDQRTIDALKRLQKENGEDIGAREVDNDSNYFVPEEHIQNPAFESIDKKESKKVPQQQKQQQHANDVLEDNRNKLKNEVNNDQGKAYADEMNFQMEDEDDDEYDVHRGHQQGQAVRERR